MSAVDAVIFDFNGTIVDDERLLGDIYVEVLADHGVPFDHADFPGVAGLPDIEAFAEAFRRAGRTLAPEAGVALLQERTERYKGRVGPAPVEPHVVAFIDAVARRVPVAIASGAFRDEIEHTLGVAGLLGRFPVVVTIDDVRAGKPDPEGFLVALDRLRAATGTPIATERVVVVEDATAGAAAAAAAGMRCLALRGAAYDDASGHADWVVDRLDAAVAERLLAGEDP